MHSFKGRVKHQTLSRAVSEDAWQFQRAEASMIESVICDSFNAKKDVQSLSAFNDVPLRYYQTQTQKKYHKDHLLHCILIGLQIALLAFIATSLTWAGEVQKASPGTTSVNEAKVSVMQLKLRTRKLYQTAHTRRHLRINKLETKGSWMHMN